MNMGTQVQILDKADCISDCTNSFGKSMNPIILSPAMRKITPLLLAKYFADWVRAHDSKG